MENWQFHPRNIYRNLTLAMHVSDCIHGISFTEIIASNFMAQNFQYAVAPFTFIAYRIIQNVVQFEQKISFVFFVCVFFDFSGLFSNKYSSLNFRSFASFLPI